MIGEWLALLFLGVFGVGLFALFRRPAPVEGMLAAQLLGTTGVALVLVLEGPASGGWVALTLAILAGVAGVTFVRRHTPPPGGGE